MLRLVFHAELKRRWRSWLVLSVLIALVGGVVLAAVAGGRRTASAFPRFERAHGYDVVDFNFGPPIPALEHLPQVASVVRAVLVVNGQPSCACAHQIDPGTLNIISVSSRDLRRTVNLLAGRMPNPSAPGN